MGGITPSRLRVYQETERTKGLKHYPSFLEFKERPPVDISKSFNNLKFLDPIVQNFKINGTIMDSTVTKNFLKFMKLNETQQNNMVSFSQYLINSEEIQSKIIKTKDPTLFGKKIDGDLGRYIQLHDRISILNESATTDVECIYFGRVGKMNQLCCFKWGNDGIYFADFSDILRKFSKQPYVFVYRPVTLYSYEDSKFEKNLARTYLYSKNQPNAFLFANIFDINKI